MKALFSLVSDSLGGWLFCAHLSTAFFFLSIGFFGSAFLVAGFLPDGLDLLALPAMP